MLQQRGPRIPRHPAASNRHVVAAERADGNALRGRKPEPLGKCEKILLQPEKHLLAAVHQVQLVDGHKQVRNTQQRSDMRMAPRLWEQALGGVDQDHGEVCCRSTRRHISGVLLVARCVGDDELPPGGTEIAVGHINGDSLFALSSQPIRQQGEINRSSRAVDLAFLHRGELVLVDLSFDPDLARAIFGKS